MAEQSLLAKLGLRTGTLGSSGSLAIAFGANGGSTPSTAHTAANRTGLYASLAGGSETIAMVVGGQTGPTFIRSGSNVNVSVIGSITASQQLISTVSTGTAPLAITSATLVPNLYVARAVLADSSTTIPNLTGPISSVGTVTSITAQTGTGTTFVVQNSPTLTTPVIGAATGTSLSVSGQLTSTVSTGTAPLVVSSTTVVGNLNVSQLLGGTWAIPGTIGSTTPNTGAFTDVTANTYATTVQVISGTAVTPAISSGAWMTWAVTANSTFAAPSGMISGQTALVQITQTGGPWSVTFSGITWPASVAQNLTQTSGAVDTLYLRKIGSIIYGEIIPQSAPFGINQVIYADSNGFPTSTVGFTFDGTNLALPAALSCTNGGTGLNTSAASNGQLLIGNGTGFTLAALTAGSNITITNSAGGISIASTGAGISGSGASGQVTFWNGTSSVTGGANFTYASATGLAVTSGSAPLTLTQSAQASGSPTAFLLTGGAHSALAASTEAIDANFALNRTVTFATGALTTQRAVVFQAPTYAFAGTSTLTTAATVAITGAPVAGANATITNSYALLIQGGNVGLADASNITLGTTTGTKFGTATTQKLSFFNATPVVQQTGEVATALATLGLVTSGTYGVAKGGTGVDGSAAANGTLLIGNGSGYTLTTLTAGSNITITNSAGGISIAASGGGGGGTVTSVNVAIANYTSSGAITTSGTITMTATNQSANVFWAGPTSGGAAAPTWRGIVSADLTTALTTPPAIGGVTPSTAAFTTISATGQITSTVSTGTAPLVIASTTVVANLHAANSDQLLGGTWAIPGTIGSSTPNTGAFTTISATGAITSTLATGTAPFTVASTTNVANLNASSLSGATFAAPGTIGGGTPAGATFTTLVANTSISCTLGLTRSEYHGLSMGRAAATGTDNIFLGQSGARNTTSGSRNVGMGISVLDANTTSGDCVAIGFQALKAVTIAGNQNTGVGSSAGQAITTGQNNTGCGYATLKTLTTGSNNTAVGSSALTLAATSDANNTAVGAACLGNVAGGSGNTAIGKSAGATITTGTGNLYLGYGADASAAGVSNECVIGSSAAPIRQIYIGQGYANASNASALTIQATGGSGTDIVGQRLNLAAGAGTGAGACGALVLQYAPVGSTGTLLNTQSDGLTLSSLGNVTINAGNLIIDVAGKYLSFKSGTNTRAGTATMVAGTVTVSNTTVTANTIILISRKVSGGTPGTAITYTVSANTSFTINSDNPLDTSTFAYLLIENP